MGKQQPCFVMDSKQLRESDVPVRLPLDMVTCFMNRQAVMM